MTLLVSLLLERASKARCSLSHKQLRQHCRFFASSTQQEESGGTIISSSASSSENNNNNTNQRIFVSDFDGDCALFISRLLEKFPVTLKYTDQYGMGLFASRDVRPGAEVLFENPAFPLTPNVMKKLEQAVAVASPGVEITADSLAVAAMVDQVVSSTQYPCRPSAYLPIRCLGSVPGQPHDLLEEAFSLIGKAYNLPETIWTREECRLLHDKVTTNMYTMVDTELYIAVSMINHSCDPNVGWSSADPLRSLVASRSIGKDQQLFYNYGSDLADHAERHAFLLDAFGFCCTCSVCRTAGLA
jgi:SET domain